jgi:hypothetical protein
LLVQSVLLGAAVLAPIAFWRSPVAFAPLLWVVCIAGLLHLLMVWGETTLAHATAHAHTAIWEMTHGRYRAFFWMGIFLSLIGLLAPFSWMGMGAVPATLIGLFLYEHAYVQAGQSVPLA